MITTYFRLLIAVDGPPEDVTGERLKALIDTLETILNSAAGDHVGFKLLNAVNSPQFDLQGELPEGASVADTSPQLLAVACKVDLGGWDFELWARGFADRIAGLLPARIIVQSDVLLSPALWADAGAFGTLAQGLQLIGKPQFVPPAQPARVNVVIVDQGFDGIRFGDSFKGGISVDGRQPGAGHSRHAAMLARNVLAVAPHAKLYDCPLIPTPPPGAPDVIDDVGMFTLAAASLSKNVAIPLVMLSNLLRFGSWIFVNAWAIFDRQTDIGPIRYCDDERHLLNRGVQRLVNAGADVVFAAGNCGEFDHDRRCTAQVRGPGNSILGANSLASVVTAGAVRTELVPLGYCSQAPGQQRLGLNKPDICAPTQFTQDDDRGDVNSGTSAATAITAGVIAALRSQWPSFPSLNERSSGEVQDALIRSAHPLPPFGGDLGIGAGVVNLPGAAARLK